MSNDSCPDSDRLGTVLVVDDEKGVRAMVRRTLERLRYRVIEASSVEDALQCTEDSVPDAIVLDLVLPEGTSGITGVAVFKQRWRDVEIVILSGHADCSNALTCGQRGAGEFVVKGLPTSLLIAAVARAVERARNRRATSRPPTRSGRPLSLRLVEISEDIANGMTSLQIASNRNLSVKTVNSHVEKLHRAYDTTTRGMLVARIRDDRER